MTRRVFAYPIIDGKKQCPQCLEWKPADHDHFNRNKNVSHGLYYLCISCQRQANGVRTKKYVGRYKTKVWALRKKHRLRRKYGLTEAGFRALLDRQEEKCAICGDHLTKPCIDHCHATGRVRGVLCGLCNTGLGSFCDDSTRLNRAITYLNGTQDYRGFTG